MAGDAGRFDIPRKETRDDSKSDYTAGVCPRATRMKKSHTPLFAIVIAGLMGIGTAAANTNGVFTGQPHLHYWFYGGAVLVFLFGIWLHFRDDPKVWFAIEAPAQVHNHIPFEMFIRNCGPRSIRAVRFDPVKSRDGLIVSFSEIASLAPEQRVRVGFNVRTDDNDAAHIGISAHIVSFFEGGSRATDQPPYSLLIHSLDGNKQRAERHILEGHPLPTGGITLNTHPDLRK